MKYRNGFVSNSSSSSFIVFFKYVEQSNLNRDYDKIENPIWGLGDKSNGEGEDFFEIDGEMLMFLVDKINQTEKHGIREYVSIEIYEVFDMLSIEEGCNKEKLSGLISNLPDKFEIQTIKKGWNSTDNLYEMIRRYFPKDKKKVKDYED